MRRTPNNTWRARPRRSEIETLERRVLLAAGLDPTSGGGTASTDSTGTFVGDGTGVPAPGYSIPAAVSRPGVKGAAVTSDHVDAVAVRDQLVRFVDTWNGGRLGNLGTSGMGTYSPTWDGLFRTHLDRRFDPINAYTNDQTIISQARAIYINVEAYRNAPAAERARFRAAVQRGADYLLSKAVDPSAYNGKPGGMWWGLQSDGVSPPTHTREIGGTAPRDKSAYGQVQSLFALAHAYTVTGDVRHLDGAFAQLDVWNGQFADTAAGLGAFLPTANENYTQRVDTRNVDYMTHALEALLTLDEVTPAAHPRKAGLAAQVTSIGNFITTRMYRDAPGSTTTGYLPWNYDPAWNPDPDPALRYSTPGHNFEVAFLLSRAVERGFNPAWLGAANKLVAYTLRYGFDNAPASPTYGAVPNGKLAFDGSRFDPAPPDLVWWQQSEAARTLLHFAAVRGRDDLWDEYDAASAFIGSRLVDPVYGGWFTHLDPSTLAPATTVKGTVWTGGYHETMLDAERIRVATADGAQGYEAEQAAVTGAAVSSSHPGFSGTGYVDYAHADGDSVEFAVTAPAAGPYELRFRYANGGTADRALGLSVNGVAVPGGLTFARTGSWRAWGEVAVAVPLAAGANGVKLSATGQSGPNLDSLSVRAAPPPPAVTYQAEAARLWGALVAADHAGYTGSGFADYQNRSGDYAEFAVDVPASGDYSLDFRYANGSTTDRPLELTVDGVVTGAGLAFAPTGSWGAWKTVTQRVALTAGRHAVRLTTTGSNGPNLDALAVTRLPAPPPPVTLQAESAVLSGAVVGRGNSGFTGTGYADYRNASGDYVEFAYDAPSAGRYRLDFRYANGAASDRPLELKVNGAITDPRVSFAATGSWSRWSTSSATVALAAGTNRIRLTAAGSSGPNLDAVAVAVAPAQAGVSYVAQQRSVPAR